MTEQTLEQKVDFNPLDLAGLASQVAGGRYSVDKNDSTYVDAAINDFAKSMTDLEKIKYGDHILDLVEAQTQAKQTAEKQTADSHAGKYQLNNILLNHFNHMEKGYMLTLMNSKVKDLNEALAKLGYKGEKLAVDENLTIKDIAEKVRDKETAEKASEKDKIIANSISYLQSTLIEVAGSKLLNDSIDLKIKSYNEALKPKEKKKAESIEHEEA